MEAHDISISELQGTNENLNLGMAPLDMTESVAENLTRVRLVHFTKNNNEPMVKDLGDILDMVYDYLYHHH